MLELVHRTIRVAGRCIEFQLPADPEQILQLALDGEAAGEAGSDPYWGLLWAAAPLTAELILRHAWSRPLRTMELGCGVGVAGIAALLAGHDVTFADHSPLAVQTAVANAARNGFANVPGLVFPWSQPPAETCELIIASDVLYDAAGHEPLLQTLTALATESTIVWIGDAGRVNAPGFVERAVAAGWSIEMRDQSGRPVATQEHLRFRLISMRKHVGG
jgi:predicted nicotinamide N-methyase